MQQTVAKEEAEALPSYTLFAHYALHTFDGVAG
jgi:hypothetical protein